ncbi:hypothetical protein [Streptomyces sp. NPDC049906]|uniref:hypothetical protein n=1 Tax=Streptomyces sp. NPDC049906 TaxID=3155656 RepID=UPI003449EA89
MPGNITGPRVEPVTAEVTATTTPTRSAERPSPPFTVVFLYDRSANSPASALCLARVKSAREYAADRGWRVRGEFVDLGPHALLDNNRPAWGRLLLAVRTSEAPDVRLLCLVPSEQRLATLPGVRRALARELVIAGARLVSQEDEERT